MLCCFHFLCLNILSPNPCVAEASYTSLKCLPCHHVPLPSWSHCQITELFPSGECVSSPEATHCLSSGHTLFLHCLTTFPP